MAKDKLTAKQERFVQELIKGKSQRQAYKEAYPNSFLMCIKGTYGSNSYGDSPKHQTINY